MNSYLSPRVVVGAALVGIVGAAGMFIYEQIHAEKRRAMLVREVARLDKQVSSMRTELEALRELQKETQVRRQRQRKSDKVKRREKVSHLESKAVPSGDSNDGLEQSYASDSEYFTDYQSVLGTDAEMDSEEFYDVHTEDEDDTLRETARNGIALDSDTLDEDLSDKTSAPKTTQNNSS